MKDEIDKAAYRDRFSKAFGESASALSVDQIDALARRLKDMIDYAIGRVDYYERYRTTYQTIGMALIVAGFAFTGGVLANFDKLPFIPALIFVVTGGDLVIGGFRLVYIYIRDTSREYPHRQVSDIKSWYFKYNIPQDKSQRTSATSLSPVEKYAVGFESYIVKWLSHASSSRNLLFEDIEQVFILFTLQDHKHGYAREMAKTMRWYLTIGILLFLVGVSAMLISKFGGNSSFEVPLY